MRQGHQSHRALEKPLILFIDAYDSFSNNIISLLETTIDADVRTVKIDDSRLQHNEALYAELGHYNAVVCGPGPGHPEKKEDIGIMKRIWALGNRHMLPVLGICLGFQSLCWHFGGEVKRLKGPQHGIIRGVTHIGESEEGQGTIFEGVGDIHATHYQSLCVDLGHDRMDNSAFQGSKWTPTESCPDLLPLAWAEWDENEDNDSGMKDEKILVAVQHKKKPFWALQYHPESICTNEESRKIIENWAQQVEVWNRSNRRRRIIQRSEGSTIGVPAVRESLLRTYQKAASMPYSSTESVESPLPSSGDALEPGLKHVYQCLTVHLPDHTPVADIMEGCQGSRGDQILLESSNAHEIHADVKGRYSIIGIDVAETLRFEYTIGAGSISVAHFGDQEASVIDLAAHGGVWPFFAHFLEERRIVAGNLDSPFWGGFMGYTTYELGLESIKAQNPVNTSRGHPDLCFAWVTRSMVIDHEKSLIYLQDISAGNSDSTLPSWMTRAALKLEALALPNTLNHLALLQLSAEQCSSSRSSVFNHSIDSTSSRPRSSADSIESSAELMPNQALIKIHTPIDTDYECKVQDCQSYISSGDSYELCLTDETTVTRPRLDSHFTSISQASTNADSWSLYRTLRTRQPAPFASYLRLGSATLISSSPERFLSWKSSGLCELRPMKGTVRKSSTVSSLEQAEALLDIPKEKAENLMIVDLVRHDLHGICGSGNVSVPRLMVVEEYRSVFQMISIVQGQIPQPSSSGTASGNGYTGIDVLAASLPPGSMTGAPKKRSCEILAQIEGRERGLYSGVVGYMDVGGRGDWSVTIRSMFRWDDEYPFAEGNEGSETWHIGAGGAVTTLSTPVGEREEMRTKLKGTLGVFE